MVRLATILLGTMLLAAPAMAQNTDSSGGDANIEIFIQKIKADKKLLVASNMDLTDAEGKKFWPLYDAYQKELWQINEQLGKTINDYAEAYNAGKGTIPEETAKKLLKEALSVEEAELKLKKTYVDKIGKSFQRQKLPVTTKSKIKSGPFSNWNWSRRFLWFIERGSR